MVLLPVFDLLPLQPFLLGLRRSYGGVGSLPHVLSLYNTGKQKVKPLDPGPGPVRIYVCGPTVQGSPHVGHARSYVLYDVLKRWLLSMGNRVLHVQNYTDVEESIARQARSAGVPIPEFADQKIREFEEAMEALHVLPPDVKPRVSTHIPDIISLVQTLEKKGVTYSIEGEGGRDLYFDTSKDPLFGTLLGRRVEDLVSSPLSDNSPLRHPTDFVLWRSSQDWGITWDSPWGRGRPGWHVECTAMSLRYLGPRFDIHGGGRDLIFPHHECESAAARFATGEEFCRFFVHHGFVTLGGTKLSKSSSIYTPLPEVLEKHTGRAVRAHLLQAHYREDLEWSETRVRALEEDLALLPPSGRGGPQPPPSSPLAEAFSSFLNLDLDTPRALDLLLSQARILRGDLPTTRREEVREFLAWGSWILGIEGRM